MKEPAAITPPVPTLEDIFEEFVNAVRLATDLTAVNIAAGVAWTAAQQITG